jgi:putative lipoic acid-binding regulatory protein
MSDKPLLEFPCDYPIKIIGRSSDNFDSRIITIINRHQEKPFEGELRKTDSKEKNYQSITVTIQATSKEQLQALFDDLKKDEDVVMVL